MRRLAVSPVILSTVASLGWLAELYQQTGKLEGNSCCECVSSLLGWYHPSCHRGPGSAVSLISQQREALELFAA